MKTLIFVIAISCIFGFLIGFYVNKTTVEYNEVVKTYRDTTIHYDTVIKHDTFKIEIPVKKIITKLKIDTFIIKGDTIKDTSSVCKVYEETFKDGNYVKAIACSRFLPYNDPTFSMSVDFRCKTDTLRIKNTLKLETDSIFVERKKTYRKDIAIGAITFVLGILSGIIIK